MYSHVSQYALALKYKLAVFLALRLTVSCVISARLDRNIIGLDLARSLWHSPYYETYDLYNLVKEEVDSWLDLSQIFKNTNPAAKLKR